MSQSRPIKMSDIAKMARLAEGVCSVYERPDMDPKELEEAQDAVARIEEACREADELVFVEHDEDAP